MVDTTRAIVAELSGLYASGHVAVAVAVLVLVIAVGLAPAVAIAVAVARWCCRSQAFVNRDFPSVVETEP